MNFSHKDKVIITQSGYIDDMLKILEVTGFASTPTEDKLFNLDGTSTLLQDRSREEFHSVVAILLYIAKHTRPDILLPVSFLTTRVLTPTEPDRIKLDRVLRYGNTTPTLGLTLRYSADLRVLDYTDAAFAVHIDFHSHTGTNYIP